MPRIFTLDTAFTDSTIPKLQWLDDYVTKIKALSPHAWWDMALPANYTAVSGKLSQVTDLSGNNRHLVQATDANRPPVNTTFFGTFNGVSRGAAVFDGTTDLYMKTSSTPFDGSGVWTMVLFDQTALTGNGNKMAFSTDGTGTFGAFYNTSGFSAAFNSAVVGAANRLNTPTARIARINYPGTGNADYYLETAGVVVTANAVVGTNVPTGNAQLGAYQSGRGSFKFNGAVGEVILFKSDLTTNSTSMQLIRDYLAFKYR